MTRQLPDINYLRNMADVVGLKDWDFFVVEDDDDSPYQATCAIVVGQKRAQLGFPSGFNDIKPHHQRLAITHELLHCHLDRWKIVFNRLAPLLTDREYDLMELAFRDVMEEAVDGIASALAVFLPLPPLPVPCESPSQPRTTLHTESEASEESR